MQSANPQIKLELAVLSVFLWKTELIANYIGTLAEKDFTVLKNGKIWALLESKITNGDLVDMVIVGAELDINMSELFDIADLVEHSTHLPEYIKILKENTCKREINSICQVEKNPEIMAEQIWEVVSKLKTEDIAEYTLEELAELAHKVAKDSNGTEFSFGIPAIQNKTQGFNKHETIVIGGYPSHGKTALATNMAIKLAQNGVKVLYLTAEQSELEMMWSIQANMCQINTLHFRSGEYSKNKSENQKVLDAKNTFSTWDLLIRRVTNTADIHKFVKKTNPEVVIIDYLQNLAPAKAGISAHQRDTENMGFIQNMTIREPIATITLSQLHRPKTGEKLKRPNMQSFMNTGAIEQKANIAMLCWWEWKAKEPSTKEIDEEPNKYIVDVCKAKMGSTGDCNLTYIAKYCFFQRYIDKKKAEAEEMQIHGGKTYEKGNYL